VVRPPVLPAHTHHMQRLRALPCQLPPAAPRHARTHPWRRLRCPQGQSPASSPQTGQCPGGPPLWASPRPAHGPPAPCRRSCRICVPGRDAERGMAQRAGGRDGCAWPMRHTPTHPSSQKRAPRLKHICKSTAQGQQTQSVTQSASASTHLGTATRPPAAVRPRSCSSVCWPSFRSWVPGRREEGARTVDEKGC
jgi:hypothetical protein